jgi:hypothetical protein
MKKNNAFAAGMVIILLIFVIPEIIFSQGSGKTGFPSLSKGDTINTSENFKVAVEIGNFDKTTEHYWIAIASVKDYRQDWERVHELYKKFRNKRNSKRNVEMNLLVDGRLINSGQKNMLVIVLA